MRFLETLEAIEEDLAQKEPDTYDPVQLIEAFKSQQAIHTSQRRQIQGDDDPLKTYFEAKKYPNLRVLYNSASSYEKEAAFFQNIEKALYLKFRKKQADSNAHFDRAEGLQTQLVSTFIRDQLKFAKELEPEKLADKLDVDRLAGLVDGAWDPDDPDKAVRILGSMLTIADKIDDKRRKLGALYKCQFALYSESGLRDFPNTSFHLGKYLIQQGSAMEHHKCLQIWCHFHCGNVRIRQQKFAEAKEEFLQALDIASQTANDYAKMTMYERLGLIAGKDPANDTEAFDYYDKSTGLTNRQMIPLKWGWQCEVHRLVGLGNIHFRRAEKGGGEKAQNCQQAEDYYQRAIQMANLIQYNDNLQIAQDNLKELKNFC